MMIRSLIGRYRLVLGATALALAVAPGAARATTPPVSAPGGDEFSLAKAVAVTTTEPKDAHVDIGLKIDAEGQTFSVGIGSDFDAETGRMKAAVKVDGLPSDLGSMIPGFSGETSVVGTQVGTTVPAPPQSISVDLIVDYRTAQLFVDTSQLPIPLGATKRFVQVDLTQFGGADIQKQLSEALDGSAVTRELDISTAVDKGPVTLDGEEVHKYELTVDIAKVLAENPQLEGQIDSSVGDIPATVPTVVYVTRDNRIRGVDMNVTDPKATVAVEVRMPDTTGDITVDLPDPAEVEPMPNLPRMPGFPGTMSSIFGEGSLPPAVVGTLPMATTG